MSLKDRLKSRQDERLRTFLDGAKNLVEALELVKDLSENGCYDHKSERDAIKEALNGFERDTNTCILEFEWR